MDRLLIQRIQDALSPDLIDVHWQAQAKENPLHGYCYVASEALYHLWGKANGFTPAQTMGACRTRAEVQSLVPTPR